MTIEQTIYQIAQLPVCEQLQIINSVWDNMSDEDVSDLSDEQRQELDRRVKKYRDNATSAMTESELRAKLRARHEEL